MFSPSPDFSLPNILVQVLGFIYPKIFSPRTVQPVFSSSFFLAKSHLVFVLMSVTTGLHLVAVFSFMISCF